MDTCLHPFSQTVFYTHQFYMMRPTLSEHPGTLHSRDRFQYAVILTYLYHEVAGYYHIGSHTNSTLAPPWWRKAACWFWMKLMHWSSMRSPMNRRVTKPKPLKSLKDAKALWSNMIPGIPGFELTRGSFSRRISTDVNCTWLYPIRISPVSNPQKVFSRCAFAALRTFRQSQWVCWILLHWAFQAFVGIAEKLVFRVWEDMTRHAWK